MPTLLVMDRSTLDTTNDSVIIDYQTGVRFKRSNGSHFQQNPVMFCFLLCKMNSTFINTTFSL